MRNSEMIDRFKLAGEYQRKAIYALFSEEMGEHLDVIEKELKLIAMKVITELLKECNGNNAFKERQSQEQTSKVKKVDIG